MERVYSFKNPTSLEEEAIREASGLALVQYTQKGEALAQTLGLPIEARNRYKLATLPRDKIVKKHQQDQDGWVPSSDDLAQLHEELLIVEESSWLTRCCFMLLGCGNLRPIKLHFYVNGKGEAFTADREFYCGGMCCHPVRSSLSKDGRQIGRVRENFDSYLAKCFDLCCRCTGYHDVDLLDDNDDFQFKYQLRVNMCCCGRVNNCCGASCCKNDMIFDVLDKHGEIVATIQKTYGKSKGMGACCRMAYQFSNYMLSFPPDSTLEERMMLITAILQIEYLYFEKSGNE